MPRSFIVHITILHGLSLTLASLRSGPLLSLSFICLCLLRTEARAEVPDPFSSVFGVSFSEDCLKTPRRNLRQKPRLSVSLWSTSRPKQSRQMMLASSLPQLTMCSSQHQELVLWPPATQVSPSLRCGSPVPQYPLRTSCSLKLHISNLRSRTAVCPHFLSPNQAHLRGVTLRLLL